MGLFSGLSGLALSASELSRGGTRYRRLLTTLDQSIVPGTFALANRLRGQQNGVGVGDFDVISGLSGVGAYLLRRYGHPCKTQAWRRWLMLSWACWTKWMAFPSGILPPALLWDEELKTAYPYGNLNCGLAHGIPGPLAVLSLGLQAGLPVSGLPQAIAVIADWLCEHRCDDGWGVNWPGVVPIVKAGAEQVAPDPPSRCAWCYGSPGVARSLWLAGDALDRSDYRELSVSAMEAVFRRPVRNVASTRRPSAMVWPVFWLSHCVSRTTLAQVFSLMLAAFLFSSCLTAISRSRCSAFVILSSKQRGRSARLLDGAPGVALVLLAAAARRARRGIGCSCCRKGERL